MRTFLWTLFLTVFLGLWAATYFWQSKLPDCVLWDGCSGCPAIYHGGIPLWWEAEGPRRHEMPTGLFSTIGDQYHTLRVDTRAWLISIPTSALPSLLFAALTGGILVIFGGWRRHRIWVAAAALTTLTVLAMFVLLECIFGSGWVFNQPGSTGSEDFGGTLGLNGLLIFSSAVISYRRRQRIADWLERRQRSKLLQRDHDWAHETPQGWDQAAAKKDAP